MTSRYFEDLVIGETWVSREFTIDEQDVVAFGRSFDPQPFHIDAEAAKTGPFGGLIASGWHLASLAMRLCVEARTYGDIPVVGIGVDELRWFLPVRPGDKVHVERELVEVMPVPNRPRRGTAKARVDMINQRGELVMRMYGMSSVPRRSPLQEMN
ncbi:MaoC family dehydratase [Paraburkholderia caribensis]|uniref:MaoC family dehydratase n=1 Tax=Paraburkholderia TaxID=1822464 RepID=UPI001CB17869|nr:MaoC family dehydratase [Paraburkholderia caribensis]BEU25689.1 MaoC family dehydratase [Paraburkholderia sp. 22B1P]CAG9249425.1 Acyl dehydratase [Paraburkholderia caribensis]